MMGDTKGSIRLGLGARARARARARGFTAVTMSSIVVGRTDRRGLLFLCDVYVSVATQA